MDTTALLPFIPPKWQAIIGASLVVFKALDLLMQVLHASFPGNKTIAVIEHWTGNIAPRLPKTLAPAPAPVIGSKVTSQTPGAVPPAAALLFLLPFLHLSCATTPLGTALINCGEADLSTSATQLGPSVLSLLSGGAVDWAAQLSSLVVTQGVAVVCAVQAIVQSIQGKLAVGELAPADQIALLRAQAFLGAYGATVSGAEIHIASHQLLKQ